MSPRHHLATVIVLAALLSSGCCLMSACGPCAGPVANCDGACDGGPGCLGMGCLGRLLHAASAGCTSGCGEVYYHDWISDPPCPDPCDIGTGSWTGAGPIAAHEYVAEPGCGATVAGPVGASCGACDSRCALQGPGRLLFNTWTGVGGIARGIKHGLFAHHGRYSAWGHHASLDCGGCDSCQSAVPSCGVPHCSTCSTGVNPQFPHEVVSHETPSFRAHETPSFRAHGRPPHKLLARRADH